jgi:hypothetical protein
VRVVPQGDRWIQMGTHWMRIRVTPRDLLYTPSVDEDWPDLSTLSDTHFTVKSYVHGRTQTISDDWRDATSESDDSSWTGTTTLLTRTSSGSTTPSDVPVHIVEVTRGDDIMSTRPWDGDHPPRSIYADSVFVRRDDGLWCKQVTVGILYPVNINGERCAKPRKLGVGLDPNDGQRRPSSISPHVWWQMMT